MKVVKPKKNKVAAGWTYAGPDGRFEIVGIDFLLRDFIQTTQKGEQVPQVVMQFMAYVAKRLLAGDDLRKTLRLARPSSRPNDFKKTLSIAKDCLREDMKGLKLTDIYDNLNKKYGFEESSDHIKGIYEKWWFQAALEENINPKTIPSKKKYFHDKQPKGRTASIVPMKRGIKS